MRIHQWKFRWRFDALAFSVVYTGYPIPYQVEFRLGPDHRAVHSHLHRCCRRGRYGVPGAAIARRTRDAAPAPAESLPEVQIRADLGRKPIRNGWYSGKCP